MVTIGEALRTHLTSDTIWKDEHLGLQIAELVGTRVYPVRLPQEKKGVAYMPAIVLTRISGLRFGHLRGPAGLARPRYQVDSWDRTHLGASTLGALCRRRLEGFAGTWADEDSPAIEVRVTVQFEDERDFFEEEISGGLCRHSADYFIFHGTAGGTL